MRLLILQSIVADHEGKRIMSQLGYGGEKEGKGAVRLIQLLYSRGCWHQASFVTPDDVVVRETATRRRCRRSYDTRSLSFVDLRRLVVVESIHPATLLRFILIADLKNEFKNNNKKKFWLKFIYTPHRRLLFYSCVLSAIIYRAQPFRRFIERFPFFHSI